jgi:2-iminobutanoate/2-iminopropanoate deaminase
MRRLLAVLLLTVISSATLLPATKKIILPPEFIPARGAAAPPYSPGILVDGTLYVSGQIGRNLRTNEIPSDFESEVKLCLENVGLVLRGAGMTYRDVVSVQVYLTDMDLFSVMNGIYTKYFTSVLPARTTVGVGKLASPAAHIEITVTARK